MTQPPSNLLTPELKTYKLSKLKKLVCNEQKCYSSQLYYFFGMAGLAAIVYSNNVLDALHEAADADLLKQFEIEEENVLEYFPDEEYQPARLGNDGKPHDLEYMYIMEIMKKI